MLKGRVLICDPIDESGIKVLLQSGLTVDYRPHIDHEELRSAARNYDVIIVRSRTKISRDVIESCDSLRIIGRAGAGLDNIDVEAAKNHGVRVLNVEEAVTNAVAELTIGLMIALLRHVEKGFRGLRQGEWLKSQLIGNELRGKTLGVIGLGRIGSRVAELGRVLGMEVLANDIVEIGEDVIRETNAKMVSLEFLLKNSDIVTLHVTLTDRSRKMINEEKLRMMKPTSFLINSSRGAVIDEEALYMVLSEGRIKGAALDVFETEPPNRSKLFSLPNVLCTPHIGAQTVEAQSTASRMLADRIVEELQGLLPSSGLS